MASAAFGAAMGALFAREVAGTYAYRGWRIVIERTGYRAVKQGREIGARTSRMLEGLIDAAEAERTSK